MFVIAVGAPTGYDVSMSAAKVIPVEVRRAGGSTPVATLDEDIRRAEILAKLMDAQFELGGVKFGLDALIGLVPVLGDTISLAISLYPIHLAQKHKLGRWVVGRMLMNVGIDYVAGLVPVLGDAADVAIKSNIKNVELMKRAAERLQLKA